MPALCEIQQRKFFHCKIRRENLRSVVSNLSDSNPRWVSSPSVPRDSIWVIFFRKESGCWLPRTILPSLPSQDPILPPPRGDTNTQLLLCNNFFIRVIQWLALEGVWKKNHTHFSPAMCIFFIPNFLEASWQIGWKSQSFCFAFGVKKEKKTDWNFFWRVTLKLHEIFS